MKCHNKNIKLFGTLLTFKRRIQSVINISGKCILSVKLPKVFLWLFLVFSPFHSFSVGLNTEVAAQPGLCQISFHDHILPLPSISINNLTAIRDRLKTRQSIGGSATVDIAQPFSPEISEKLRQVTLLKHPGSLTLSNSMQALWLPSSIISPEEVNAIEQGLNQYFKQIKQLMFQIDGRDIELERAFISIEKTKVIHHTHKLVGNRDWISATHALIGTGSWYETIYNNERQIAVAETGKTLLLSDPYRMASLSGISEMVLDGYLSNYYGFPHPLNSIAKKLRPIEGPLHGSSPGKRLMIIVFFKLKGSFIDSGR